MSERTVKHDTIVVERKFKAPPQRVFAAWADPNAQMQWKVPGENWVLAELESDFRIGGREKSRFGPANDPIYNSSGTYLDIVPHLRIVSSFTMHERETPISSTLCTVELLRESSGTRLILTDQSAFFDGREKPSDRQAGWDQILDKLVAQMECEEAKSSLLSPRAAGKEK